MTTCRCGHEIHAHITPDGYMTRCPCGCPEWRPLAVFDVDDS